MDIIVFAGTASEYLNWALHNEFGHDTRCIFEPKDIPIGDFAFFEIGTYGTNKAWQRMRDIYGYTEEERNCYHIELKMFIERNLQDKCGMSLVPYYKQSIKCYHGFDDPLVQFLSTSKLDYYKTIDLTRIISPSGYILGAAGQCRECGRIYYSLRVVANNVNNKGAMLLQIAAGCQLSYSDIEKLYLATGNLIETEYLSVYNSLSISFELLNMQVASKKLAQALGAFGTSANKASKILEKIAKEVKHEI